MLKIGKGLKKKKKSKKNKHKEDELFTEEELEQYRKEHSQKAAEETGENSETQKTEEASEELEKFKQLTAGVDDILRKSQGDLHRIKKESFFQRKPTPSELKAQEEKEKEALKQTEENLTGVKEGVAEEATEEREDKEEESESEYEFDDKDDIFDTTYVDAIESGEVKLVYVPEDDEILRAGEPDPFDTTSAEEILKKVEEEEKKKKLQISLGLAVNVLTGRAERDKSLLIETGAVDLVEQTTLPSSKPKKRPRKIQDVVLIGSFDESNNIGFLPPEDVQEKVVEVPKSLLDDDLNDDGSFPEGDALLTEVLVKQQANRAQEVPEGNSDHKDVGSNLKDLVSEFDIINEGVTPEVRKAEEVEDEFDEFTALAASSVANQKLEEELQKFEKLEDDPFDTTPASIVLKQETADPFGNIDAKIPLPQTAELATVNQKWSAFDTELGQEEKEVDPFDTSFTEKIQPGKCELKLLENEILGDIVETAHKSDVHLEARILSRNNSDSDFNPREGEESIKPSNQNVRSKVSIQITDPSGFVETQRSSESEFREEEDLVSLSFKHRDLLGGSTTDLTKLANEPLPPESPPEDFSKYSDPFDTSIVEQVALPGKAELKFLEKELLADIPREPEEDTLSDKDFDPRREENSGQKVSFDIPSPIISDLLSGTREGARPLTPYYSGEKDNESDIGDIEDPFDTSHVTSLPGKEELKLIEKELDSVKISETVFEPIHKKLGLAEEFETESSGLKHSLSDPDFNPREESETTQSKLDFSPANRRFSDVTGLNRNPPSTLSFQPVKPDLLVVEEEHSVKALTPAIEEDFSSYIDPFDTSIAENIAPGKAELKLLESELVFAEGGIKRSYTDPDFNPRDDNTKEPVSEQPKTDILSIQEDSALSTKPLTPLDFETSTNDEIDPFDTSIATNLLPGKAEIRVLESELFGQ